MIRNVQSAFSLIELIIVAAIIMVVVGGSIAGFVRFNERQLVLNTAKELQSFVRSAQSKARVRDVPAACGSNPLEGYRVDIASNKATLSAVCTSPQQIKELIYPVGVTATVASIKFNTLEEGTDLGSDVTVTVTKDSYTFSFSINKNGAISDLN